MKIKNVNVVVDYLDYRNNHLQDSEYKLNPKLAREIGTTSDNKHYTKLSFVINGSDKQDFPMDLEVEISAIFEFTDITSEDNIDEFLSLQGVHILYPYLRSTVSAITASAMVPPVVIPIINAMTLFDHPKKK